MSDNPLEIVEPSALEAMTKAETDVQIRTAKTWPRNLTVFLEKAMTLVSRNEETARSCMFRLERKDKSAPGGMKIIEGGSIRLAEIVASCYGNMRVAARVISQTPSKVTVMAVAHDLETNLLVAQEKQAKTTNKDGVPYSEDMQIMTANALISKAIRDAVFRVVPRSVIEPIIDQARLICVGDEKTLNQKRSAALKWFDGLRISRDRLYSALGVKGEADIGLDHLERLFGIRTAVMDGEVSVDEAFPKVDSDMVPKIDPVDSVPQPEPQAPRRTRTAPVAPPVKEEPARPPAAQEEQPSRPPVPDPSVQTQSTPMADRAESNLLEELRQLMEAGGFNFNHLKAYCEVESEPGVHPRMHIIEGVNSIDEIARENLKDLMAKRRSLNAGMRTAREGGVK